MFMLESRYSEEDRVQNICTSEQELSKKKNLQSTDLTILTSDIL